MQSIRVVLLAVVLVLLMMAPAAAQPSDDEITACRVIAGQVGQGTAQAPDTLPHPDRSLEDCDGDGINDTSDPNVGTGTTDPDEVDVTTGGDGTGSTAAPIVGVDPNPGSQDLGLAGERGLIIAGGGLESMMAPPPFRGSNAPTVLEAFGYDALRLRDSNAGALDTLTNPTQSINQGIAEMLIVFAHIITATATSLLQWAFSPDTALPGV
ncbi:hypothetical protein BH24ACT15_BH24ACT15_01560 [soil metagenome]